MFSLLPNATIYYTLCIMRDSATYLPYTRAYENEIYKTEIGGGNDSGMDCRGGLWLNTFYYYMTFCLIHYSVLNIMCKYDCIKQLAISDKTLAKALDTEVAYNGSFFRSLGEKLECE
jgi:hypothetical protein